ncbi:hypothetical protein Tco_0068543, partial [Tanacetum coccineum]
ISGKVTVGFVKVVVEKVVGVGEILLHGELFIKEAISLSTRDGLSRFKSLLEKMDETEELCVGSSVFCVSITGDLKGKGGILQKMEDFEDSEDKLK